MIGSCCQLRTGFQLSGAHLSIKGSENHILLLSLVQVFYFTDNDLDKKRSKHTESTSEWQGHDLPCVSFKFLGHFLGPYLTLLLNTLFWPSLAALVRAKLAQGIFWDNYLIAPWHWPFRPVTWGAKTVRLMATRKKNRSLEEGIT